MGQIFLPRLNLNDQEATRTIVEREVLRQGYCINGWRQVPVNVAVLGDKAKSNHPEIEQIIISKSKNRLDLNQLNIVGSSIQV